MRVCHLLFVQNALAIFRIEYTNATRGDCGDSEPIHGGYWVCYNQRVCALQGSGCRGRIKCIRGEWITKRTRPTPGCKSLLDFDDGNRNDSKVEHTPDSVTVPLTISGVCSFLFLIFGTAFGYGVKICNMHKMKYSVTSDAERYREESFSLTEAPHRASDSFMIKPVADFKPKISNPNPSVYV